MEKHRAPASTAHRSADLRQSVSYSTLPTEVYIYCNLILWKWNGQPPCGPLCPPGRATHICGRRKHRDVHSLGARHMGNPAEDDGDTKQHETTSTKTRLRRVTLSDRDALRSKRERGVSFPSGPSAQAPDAAGSEEAVRRGPRRLGDGLLREEARRGDHAQPRVRQLLLLRG